MKNSNNTHAKVLRMTQVAFLAALIVVLQILSYFIKVGMFNMSFVLIPVVIGGVLFGAKVGAFLGGIFGVVVAIACIAGLDGGGFILFSANPVCCILICMIKGIAAGYVSALVYKVLSNKISSKILSIGVGAALCPIVNTGVFCIGMTVFFYDKLVEWSGGTAVLYYIFTGLIGINFVIELLLNVVLCPLIASTVLKYSKKS